MTLTQITNLIETMALQQPAVKTVIKQDVYRLNAMTSTDYGVLAWVQSDHRADVVQGIVTYSFSLIYADRLTEDESNETEVQSVGIQVLSNIIRGMSDQVIDVSEVTFTSFKHRFGDNCGGVFAKVDFITSLDGTCYDEY